MIGEQKIGIADDRGQHVVEVMRDAAGELADGLHLLALREVLLQGALLGGVEREDGRACAFVGARIGRRDEEPRRALRPRALERDVEGRDLTFALGGRLDRFAQRGMIALGDKVENRQPSRGAVASGRGLGEAGKGGVGTQHCACGVHRGDRHRGRIENAGEAHLGRAQVFALDLAGGAIDHQRAGGARRPVAGKGDLVQDARREQPALAGLQVDVELLRRHFARRAGHHGEHRSAVSGDDVVDLEPADAELGEIIVEPAGQGGVHVRDRAVGLGRKEAGRRVVEIVDRVLKILEEGFMPGVVASLIRDRPRHQAVSGDALERANANAVPGDLALAVRRRRETKLLARARRRISRLATGDRRILRHPGSR